MPVPDSDTYYDDYLGVTIKRFYFIPDGLPANPNGTLGSYIFWNKLLKLLHYSEAGGSRPVKVVPKEVFLGLTIEIYDKNYTVANVGSPTNNPADSVNSTKFIDSRGLTLAPFPGTIAISIDITSGSSQLDDEYKNSILSRQFGQHYGYRSNLLSNFATSQPVRSIHTDLLATYTALRAPIAQGGITKDNEGADFTLTHHRFAEDYQFLYGTPLSLGKYTRKINSQTVAHVDDTNTNLGTSLKMITLLRCAWSVQKHLCNKKYVPSSLVLENNYIKWRLESASVEDSTPVYRDQAIDRNLVWYEWSGSKWIPTGAETDRSDILFSATTPNLAP